MKKIFSKKEDKGESCCSKCREKGATEKCERCSARDKKSSVVFNAIKTAQEEELLQDDGLAERIQRFEKLVAAHDFTYKQSDDARYYQSGRQQYKEIVQLAKELPSDDAARIWNAGVDKKVVHGSRENFYWK